jgi:ferredoxin-type protein NapH
MTKIRIVRIVTASLVILVVVLGVVGEPRYGAICSLGAWRISLTCPLGFLERCLASRDLLPQLWLSVALVVLFVILLGRFFCAWLCPTVLLRDVFRGQGGLNAERNRRDEKGAAIPLRAHSSANPGGALELSPKGTIWASYSRYAILGGTLLSSFLFGFPVFCVVCPIGLFFGSLFAVIRLFSPQSLSLELVLFPVLLGLELWVLKSWCRSICPLGALFGIIGSLNHFLLPTVRKDKCLTSQGINCRVCKRVCPEGIDLVNISSNFSVKDCTKCLECYEKCPAKAIRIRLFSPFHRKGKTAGSTTSFKR